MLIDQYPTARVLFDAITELAYPKQYTMIRVYERNKSYEDFSISYTLLRNPVNNFRIIERDNMIQIQKRDRHSTRHIMFQVNCLYTLECIERKKPYIALKIDGDVFYTDGSHRYQK
jgi:hypothetical protein